MTTGVPEDLISQRTLLLGPFYKGTMFYDLNVPYSPDDPEALHTLNFLAERKSLCPDLGTRSEYT